MTPASQFHGIGGALLVSAIAFSIVFIVLAGLCATIYFNRYIAMNLNKKDKANGNNGNIDKPIGPTASDNQSEFDNDMKKVIAAISAAVIITAGGNMNVLNAPRAESSSSPCMTQMWRAAGIAECMGSRLGSRSW